MGVWSRAEVGEQADRPPTVCPTDGPGSDSSSAASEEKINLRLWFACFVGWMILLTAAASWGINRIDDNGSGIGWAVCILSLSAFYLSLCCAFFPAPTTWIVLLAASDMVAAQVGIVGHETLRLVVVSATCATATALANLNEYHIVAYISRNRRVAKVRRTRLYLVANAWFEKSPFWIVMLFSFIPIPVDVIRWLAIFSGYSRWRFFLANVIGRWCRYALWAVASLGLGLTARQIAVIQVLLVAVAIIRILLRWLRHNRDGSAGVQGDRKIGVSAQSARV
jgi:membrane protein DedA with SNARE-associated domain